MPKTRALRFGSPWHGKQGRTAFADSPKGGWLHSSLNMWPFDAKTGRDRLAICPGYTTFGTSPAVNLISAVDVAAYSGAQETYARQLMIAYAGELYRHTAPTTFTQVGGSNIIDTGRTVQAASFRNKLYVANDANVIVYTYDGSHTTQAITAEAGYTGTVPSRCRLVAAWGPRLVLAGDPQNPHTINFSRVDAPADWDTAEDDVGAAVSIPNINDKVTSLIPHSRECLICGTLTACWIFRGNPMRGTLEKFSHVVGPISANAWCKDANDFTYMLTRDGLYRMAPGCGSPPQRISKDVIPESLVGLDGVTYPAYLAYDPRFRCVHIYVSGGDSFHYFPPNDGMEGGGFWPVTAPNSAITAIGRYDPIETTDASGVLIGQASNLKRIDRTIDVGTVGYAKILFPLDAPGYKSIVREASITFGDNTEDTAGVVALYGAGNAEDVVAEPAARKFSTTIGAIQANKHRCYPRISGQAGLLTITQTAAASHLSVENATLYTSPVGKERQ